MDETCLRVKASRVPGRDEEPFFRYYLIDDETEEAWLIGGGAELEPSLMEGLASDAWFQAQIRFSHAEEEVEV
jgi:hypothetical protein